MDLQITVDERAMLVEILIEAIAECDRRLAGSRLARDEASRAIEVRRDRLHLLRQRVQSSLTSPP